MDWIKSTGRKIKLFLKETMHLSLILLRKICLPGLARSMSNAPNEQPKENLFVDLDEDYAKSFRKESYHAFWTRGQIMTGDPDEGYGDSTSRSRLPSYRLFAGRLLESDQEMVRKLLQFTAQTDIYYNLLWDYFNNSADTSKLCGILLENIEQARLNYNRSVQNVLETVPISGNFTEDQHNFIIQDFIVFVDLENSFAAPSTQHFQNIREQNGDLQSQLELHREKLDAAAKGSYILNRDLDTMSRLVRLLHDEVEHNKDMMRFCLQKKDDRPPVEEVVKMLKTNDSSFRKQLDELEECVFLCFMSINKARSLVIKQIQMQQIHG
jgi:hypothetical protein